MLIRKSKIERESAGKALSQHRLQRIILVAQHREAHIRGTGDAVFEQLLTSGAAIQLSVVKVVICIHLNRVGSDVAHLRQEITSKLLLDREIIGLEITPYEVERIGK